MIRPNYLMGTKNEAFGPGGIQNAITETLVRTEGPIDAKLIDKSINENGTYSASAEGADGFKKVVVDVSNTYFLSDEGKVVSNGELVAQTARSESITENGTYDTTENNSVIVNVSGEQYGATFDEELSSFDFVSNVKKIIIPNGTSSASLLNEQYEDTSNLSFNSLEEVVLPSSVCELVHFHNTPSLSNISLTCSEVWTIRYECFKYSGIKSITLPSTSEGGFIESSAFEYSGLESITIPDNTIVSSETEVGHHFYGCNSLSTVTIGKDCLLSSDMFEDCENLETIYVNVPEGTENYENAPWGAPSTTQVIWANE